MDTPGVAFLNSAGQFEGLPETTAGQFLASTAANAYQFVGGAGPLSSSNIVQTVLQNPSTSLVVPVVAAGIPPYDAAAEFLVLSVTPVFATSTFLVEFSCSAQMTSSVAGNILSCDGYLNAGGTRIVFGQVNSGGLGQVFYTSMGGGATFSTGTTAPFTINFCLFNTQVAVSTGVGLSDIFSVTEINSLVPGTSNPTTIIIGATTALLFQVPAPATNTSSLIDGYVTFMDTNNVLSCVANFFFVVQENGDPTVVFPDVSYNTVIYNATSATPTLTFTPVLGFINVSVTGVAATTFVCQAFYNVVTTS
jgi:hypothetical protein